TTKFALLDDDGALIDSFYASNEGEPLDIAKAALGVLDARWRAAGVNLDIQGVATTGYGELLFARAFHADCHVVETVAHALAAAAYVDDATFILDIGGQDMKAIWIDDGIVTDILVNEACSSGCGSFLESFAHTLGFETADIAEAAFSSKSPAELGSRCTVFMISSVVTEQKNGKSPEDIMAGLCRSIIENVFTKVIRVSNLDSLGERIVVQGGTFANDAVLSACESYVGREVTRAPRPGLMGAIGAALFARRTMTRPDSAASPCGRLRSSFIGLSEARELTYTQTANLTCPFCTNNCARAVVTFADGSTFVTGNRCERGEIVGDPRDAGVREKMAAVRERKRQSPNLYEVRERLLMNDYPAPELAEPRNITIGLPRVLAFWDTMPFWTTFWRALGFNVKLSHPSSRSMFESGLPAVASDTICFPAKLAHGHIRDLVRSRVDRIFMPSITTVPSENTEATSESMCAVVKGYAIVMRNSDNPERYGNARLDAPLFHWYTNADRDRQLADWMHEVHGIAPELTRRAIEAADTAQATFRRELVAAGREAIERVRRDGTYAVVLASRPYHNDPLENHDLPDMFCQLGIPVIPADAVPGTEEVDLSKSRLDIVNNYHARMLSSAIIAARDPNLEYAQIVSFGCGHDAYLSDEIVRLTHEICDKSPLVLKVDESDVPGPLRIRIRSFVETINIKRSEHATAPLAPLRDPYPTKFEKRDRRERVILVPNTSHAFARLMAAVFTKQGVRAVAVPIGRERAIELGKRYVHNDICFPAQMTIGECLAELESGKYDDAEVAIGTAKYIGDCRLTHYGALLRKALDDAGYAHVPIITNDDVDYHDLHPGFKMTVASAARVAMGLPMIDALEALLRKIRPYELVPGSADAAFELAIDEVMEGFERHGSSGAQRGFARAIEYMRAVDYDRSNPRPRVLIVGEYLLNFHPGANHEIEAYLEANGLEVVEARMTDVIRKTYFYKGAQIREFGVKKPFAEATWYATANALFEHAHDVCDRIASRHPLYEPPMRMPELVEASDAIIHHTFDAGEGVLIPGEIIHHANRGCEAFVILQPFGCLPNHIVGRGIVKRLRELYPAAQILSLDYDPDVSFANVENRLQMLVMNVREGRAGQVVGEVSLDEVADSVATIASEADELAEQVLAVADTYDVGEVTRSPELLESLMTTMRGVLEREDE
ncbi:MAG: activase, partial [Eggerthellaceae bacterium]|nr:activase [Eggerthellaceae bacterium]